MLWAGIDGIMVVLSGQKGTVFRNIWEKSGLFGIFFLRAAVLFCHAFSLLFTVYSDGASGGRGSGWHDCGL